MIPTKKEHFQQIIRNRIFWPKFKAHDFSPNFSPSSSAEKKTFPKRVLEQFSLLHDDTAAADWSRCFHSIS